MTGKRCRFKNDRRQSFLPAEAIVVDHTVVALDAMAATGAAGALLRARLEDPP